MDIKNSMLLANMMSGNQSKGTLNATVVGNPTITDDFIVSGFSFSGGTSSLTGDYLMADLGQDYRTEHGILFEFVIKIKIYSFPAGQYTYNYAFGSKNDSTDGASGGVKYGGYLCFDTSSAGYISNENLNKWVWAKYTNFYANSWSGTGNLKVVYSYNGVDFTYGSGDFGMGYLYRHCSIGRYLRNVNYGSQFAFDGEIDMKETYLKIGDEIVWQGVI